MIDNQGSAAARADLNNLFQAIASQNSGATAPVTTYANMFWYETDTNTLWKRNEANSAWISLGTLDETNSKFEPNQTFATQAQAEAGTENTKAMTALRTAQAIAALAPVPTLDYELISTSTISSPVATVDFTGFNNSVYGAYAFTLHSVIPVNDIVSLFMRFSTDGGSTFISTSTYDVHSRTQQTSTVVNADNTGSDRIMLTGTGTGSTVGSAAGEFGVSGVVNLFTPNGSAKTYTHSTITFDSATSALFMSVQGFGRNSTTSAVNAVRFYFSSGNVESGRISMYGIRRV